MPSTTSQWESYPAITNAHQWSLVTIARLQSALAGKLDGVVTVAVTGSLGRLDASDTSDVDLIIVLKDEFANRPSEKQAITEKIYRAANDCGINSPTPKGIYATSTTLLELNDGQTLGKVNEDMTVFGHRMQLLIESWPLCLNENHRVITETLLARYLKPFARESGFDAVSYLLNDLIRYYRSYLVAKQWGSKTGGDGWGLKQIKVRHSRLLTYASTLIVLAEAATSPAINLAKLQERLALRPLDRVRNLFDKYGADPAIVFDSYDRFLAAMTDSTVRDSLNFQVESLSDPSSYELPPLYCKLVENGDQISRVLIQFLIDHFHENANSFLQRVAF